MQDNKAKDAWDGLSGDLFRRAYSFGLSAVQLTHVATAIAVGRQDADIEKSVINGAHSPAIWFLVGFAFELFLKSAIVARGGERAEIKSIGHDLVLALQKAELFGLELSESTRFSISVANRAHNRFGESKFFFRYGDGTSTNVETADAMIASLEDLLAQTVKLIGLPDSKFDSFLVPFQP